MDGEIADELRQAGIPEDEVPELAEIAEQMRQLPPVEPRRAWLIEAKWRMMRRFDRLQAKRPQTPQHTDQG